MDRIEEELLGHLSFLYGEDQAPQVYRRVLDLTDRFRQDNPEIAVAESGGKLSEQDVILITYADMVQQTGEKPLKTLGRFLKKHVSDVINTIHILPFYPYSSDDGFSVIDYRQVNPDFGDWEDIAKINQGFRLMFDAVINHVSSKSKIFQSFLLGDPNYESFFTVVEPGTDLSRVFRPRATPLLTPFDTPEGKKLVWTTFSADQVDLNYKSPDLLLEVIDIVLFYIANGAEFIRLDAVTYVWKEIGTSCINLPQTHRLVQLMRTILDMVAPNVVIITETNVPHRDNVAYFGDGTNEAQMVYNFALPLLTLYSFLEENASILTEWATTLDLPSDETTFFNFLAGHDGIGILPVKDILSADDLDKLIAHIKANDGYVSYKSNEDGTKSPYELNINYLDALKDLKNPIADPQLIAQRFLAAHAIMLSLRGVPGIYFHSLFGSQNWVEGVEKTGRYRTINREKMKVSILQAELEDTSSLRSTIYRGFNRLLSVRKEFLAFHPYTEQKILHLHPRVFSLIRIPPDGQTPIICLHNVSSQPLDLVIDARKLAMGNLISLNNILIDQSIPISENKFQVHLNPYEVSWLNPIHG